MTITVRTLNENEMRLVHQSIATDREFFGDNYFKKEVFSQEDTVSVSSVVKNSRDLAPFVSPLVPGKPVGLTGSRVSAFSPAYISLVTPVSPEGGTTSKNEKRAHNWNPDPMVRHGENRRDITEEHLSRIKRTIEFMRAMGTIRGYVDTESEDVPAERINFGRDPSLTTTLTAGTYWGDTGVSVLDFFERVIDQMGETDGGYTAQNVLLGRRAAAFVRKQIRKDGELKDLLDRNYGTESTLVRGLSPYSTIRELGRVNHLNLFEYSESFRGFDAKGNRVWVKPLADNEICVIGAEFEGVDAYGAIKDLAASYKAVPIFGRNYIAEGTPQREIVSHQASPIPVPVNPNAVSLHKVLPDA